VDNIPSDLTLKIMAGNNYTFSGSVVTPTANFSGELSVNVVVSDLNDDSEEFEATITVNPVNDAPVVTSEPDLTVYAGNLYAYVFTATDPDDATLTRSVVQKPDWLAFSESTGVLTGTPTEADKGQHLVILRVTDGKEEVDQDFIITVDGPEGLSDLEAAGIRVYPVPARDYLDIRFESLSESTQLEVIGANGGIVRQATVPARMENYRLDLNGVENGTYYLHIKNTTINNIGRIVIVK
jgi:hypothetical protein